MTDNTTLAPETLDLVEGGLVRPQPRAAAAAASLARALVSSPDVVSRTGLLGGELAAAAVGRSTREPARNDWRFKDPTWTENPLYRRLAQSYLAFEHHLTPEGPLRRRQPRQRPGADQLGCAHGICDQ